MVRQVEVRPRRRRQLRQLGLELGEQWKREISPLSPAPQQPNGALGICPRELESGNAAALRSRIGQVDDDADVASFDARVRRIEESLEGLRLPVVAPRCSETFVHALLNDAPGAFGAHDECVQIQIEPVLDGGPIDFGHQAARCCQGLRIESRALADRCELRGHLPRLEPLAAAHVDAQLSLDRRETSLQGPDHASRDSRRMPIHAHDGTEGLEPEGMPEPAQQIRASIFEHDGLDDDAGELGHPRREPRGYVTGVQREIGAA
jgi:hypothetical protein